MEFKCFICTLFSILFFTNFEFLLPLPQTAYTVFEDKTTDSAFPEFSVVIEIEEPSWLLVHFAIEVYDLKYYYCRVCTKRYCECKYIDLKRTDCDTYSSRRK